MKPALSVIVFTTISGAGYGLLFWFGVLTAFGALPNKVWFGVLVIGAAMSLASLGLLASTAHLGHKMRAWRAISQWRTSWLSREGVASLLGYPVAAAFLACWVAFGEYAAPTRACGIFTAIICIVTVVCTAMIYRSLTPVRQWNNRHVVPIYLLLASFSGAACLAAMAIFWQPRPARIAAAIGIALALAAAFGKLAYWRSIDTIRPLSTIESATGLGWLGSVRMLESPATEESYISREMGFSIARKHAAKLRRIALIMGFALPVVLLATGAGLAAVSGKVLLPVAALSATCGIFIERWLFFAQASHTAMLFYGRRT